jgi:hypothetical protein
MEKLRLSEASRGKAAWKRWGPYLCERQWGTVSEDYSHNGDAWNFFTHDHAHSRACRWGEDGIAGISARMIGTYTRDKKGKRPVYGEIARSWKDSRFH